MLLDLHLGVLYYLINNQHEYVRQEPETGHFGLPQPIMSACYDDENRRLLGSISCRSIWQS